jgi:ATP-dependent Clp protease ATP-binding subunit ClpC
VRRKPYSVVLFDEIEKAHPDVFNIAAADPGGGAADRLAGPSVDFKNTVMIMTSNLGTRDISKANLGFHRRRRGGSPTSG